ncbi:MAG: MFS transporter, partial [Mycobacteriales bacterium]
LLSLVFFAGVPAFFFTFSIYLQFGLGFSALHSGLTSFPFAVASGFASSRSDRLAKRMGVGVLTLGCGLLTVGMVVVIVVLHAAGTDLHSYEIAPFLLIAGLGLGCFIAPLTNLVLAGIKGREAGSASGVLSTTQQVGGALGVAVIGLLLFGVLGGHAASAAHAQAAPLTRALAGAGAPAEQVVQTFERCFVTRAKAPDPSATPPGCTPPKGTPAPVAAALGKAADTARRENFLYAIERTLLLEVAIFGLAMGLTRLLPKVDVAAIGHGAPAEA